MIWWNLLKTARSRWYPTETIEDAEYADDQALLANIPVQAKFLLHNQEQAAKGIGHYGNSDKMEFKN